MGVWSRTGPETKKDHQMSRTSALWKVASDQVALSLLAETCYIERESLEDALPSRTNAFISAMASVDQLSYK
jgi:hypothetical protein